MKYLRYFWITILIAMLLAPVGSIILKAFLGYSNISLQLELFKYADNTLVLCFLVCLYAWIMGIIPAYLVSIFSFPGKEWIKSILILPLAMPIYLLAYIYSDLFEYAGIVQSFYRKWFGFNSAQEYYFFNIRSIGGLSILMGAGLAPYVYLFTCASLQRYSCNIYETARVMGLSHINCFFKIVIPISRPAWMAGLVLVSMETIAEFGAVEYFGIQTLTLGIYLNWLERFDLVIACRMALISSVITIILYIIENLSRRKRGYFQSINVKFNYSRKTSVLTGVTILCICMIPPTISFIIPTIFLFIHTLSYYQQILTSTFILTLINTIGLSTVTAMLGAIFSLFLSLFIYNHSKTQPFVSLFFMNYMLPGTIFALGMMLWLSYVNALINSLFSTATILVGTHFSLIYVYLCRFLALGNSLISDGIETTPKSVNDAASLFGFSKSKVLMNIRLPMLKPYITAALLLIFVESIKELPMTLIMRPVGIETMATMLYQYASDENLPFAAPAGLFIVCCGILSLCLIHTIASHQDNKI